MTFYIKDAEFNGQFANSGLTHSNKDELMSRSSFLVYAKEKYGMNDDEAGKLFDLNDLADNESASMAELELNLYVVKTMQNPSQAMDMMEATSGASQFDSIDEDALRIISDTKTGELDSQTISDLVEAGFLEVEDNMLNTTRQGRRFLSSMDRSQGSPGAMTLEDHLDNYKAETDPAGHMGDQMRELGYESFTSADRNANTFLTRDIDRKMHPEEVQQMLEDGYFEVVNDQLTTTPAGDALLAYARTRDGGLRGAHVIQHKTAFENANMLADNYQNFESVDAQAERLLT